MSLRSGTQKYGISEDDFVMIDGYERNLELEKRLKQELDQVTNEVNLLGDFNPSGAYYLPSWWERAVSPGDYGWGFDTHQKALDYLKLSKRYHEAKINIMDYQCHNYPRDTIFCQHSVQYNGILSGLNRLIPIIESRISVSTPFEILPQVFAEEDPSINSGLNGNEQEYQDNGSGMSLKSANVRIVISNISMFSTSIPANDVGELQILSNASNEWRYTLIGSSFVNQPLMTLSGLINKINSMIASAVVTQPQPPIQPPTQPPIEEPPITTDHVPPPDMPVDEPPITVTPTEPGQVNWIPEPFFSFINNVFRK